LRDTLARGLRSIHDGIHEAPGAVLLAVVLLLLVFSSAFAAEVPLEIPLLPDSNEPSVSAPAPAARALDHAEPAKPTAEPGPDDAKVPADSATTTPDRPKDNPTPPLVGTTAPAQAAEASASKPSAANRATVAPARPVTRTAPTQKAVTPSVAAESDPSYSVVTEPEASPLAVVAPAVAVGSPSVVVSQRDRVPAEQRVGRWSDALWITIVPMSISACLLLLAFFKKRVKVGPYLANAPHADAQGRKCDTPVPVAHKYVPAATHVESVSAHAYVAPADLMVAFERQHRGAIRQLSAKTHALTSIAGARHENEDYALAFELVAGPAMILECLVCADGCGGHPGGRDASHLAVHHAVEALVRNRSQPPERLLAGAFAAASVGLSRAGQFWGPNDLRTTLIVLVATPTMYHLAWIGDGGCIVHRADGPWVTLLVPHKGAVQNLLAASLGPKQEGQPSFTSERLLPGDRLYLGSDGVLDMVQPAEFFAWFEERSEAGDSMQTCLDALLNLCAGDGRFDDNLTLGVLLTPAGVARASTPSIRVPVALAGDRESV